MLLKCFLIDMIDWCDSTILTYVKITYHEKKDGLLKMKDEWYIELLVWPSESRVDPSKNQTFQTNHGCKYEFRINMYVTYQLRKKCLTRE